MAPNHDAQTERNGPDEPEIGTDPGADLDPDEAADAFETDEEAQETKTGKEDERQEEDIISLDSPD